MRKLFMFLIIFLMFINIFSCGGGGTSDDNAGTNEARFDEARFDDGKFSE